MPRVPINIAYLCRIRAPANDHLVSAVAPPISEGAMKYLCLICAEKVMEQMSEADAAAHYEEYVEFTKAVRKDGHFIGANRLAPASAATTVRVRDGKILTTDGPFAETKEQLGGYYLIEAKDL